MLLHTHFSSAMVDFPPILVVLGRSHQNLRDGIHSGRSGLFSPRKSCLKCWLSSEGVLSIVTVFYVSGGKTATWGRLGRIGLELYRLE